MRSLTFITFALLTACGSDPGTTATDSAGGTTGTATTGTATTGDPATTGTGDPAPTTGSASDSATGTTTGASTTDASTGGSTGPELTGSTGPVATDTGTTGSTGGESSSGEVDGSSGSTGSDTTGAIKDCAALEQAFAAEAMKIRSCTMPAQCGQELKMTSCGCTHNWVARKDADTTHFYELLAQGQDLNCELIGPGICDCPPAEGFTCNQNICTWNYL